MCQKLLLNLGLRVSDLPESNYRHQKMPSMLHLVDPLASLRVVLVEPSLQEVVELKETKNECKVVSLNYIGSFFDYQAENHFRRGLSVHKITS